MSELKIKSWKGQPPIGGWADGNYWCQCLACGCRYEGAKCTWQCRDCAVLAAEQEALEKAKRPKPQLFRGQLNPVIARMAVRARDLPAIDPIVVDFAGETIGIRTGKRGYLSTRDIVYLPAQHWQEVIEAIEACRKTVQELDEAKIAELPPIRGWRDPV